MWIHVIFTCFDIPLLNTVYMHSWNKTVNTFCVLYLVTCCSLCQTVSRGQSYPPKLSGVLWLWMTGVLKGFQTRNVSMNLSGAWTNNSERAWIIYTTLLVLSLLSGVGKIQERIVFKNIHNYFNENNLLNKYQSGFLPNHSTTVQLIDIYHHICQTFDNNQYTCMVFCDVSKAFDRVWHKGLLFKLK